MPHLSDRHGQQDPPAATRVGLIATVASVLSAFFGVQNSRARKRDFTHGSPALFFGVALALTAAFALIILGIVHLLISQAVP
ncbi:MAG: hypothetical protein K0Q76_2845 [Panacagrimonas sp.]|jgi:hypothetical protein|nr:DUF2970 domain-containing protein [Panacagrimonas sp.]MCC2657737.1 hypothetical protein [Panacagrimonas sp.]